MARIDALPSLSIIRGLKGILDFYVWKGLPCVRAWPKYRPARQTDASLAAALLFGAVVKAYTLLAQQPLQAYQEDALDQPRTARDIMVTGVYGNLHEASMSDFLTLLTQCRDFLSNLTDLLHALDSIDTDELVVNVDQSVLPPLAATTTNQATAITALQKIDDLQDALESAALDRFLVRGMDQLFSFNQAMVTRSSGIISGANGYLAAPAPPSGKAWVITTVTAQDRTNATTKHSYHVRRAGIDNYFHIQTQAFAAWDLSQWAGHVFLDYGDVIRVTFAGAQAGDACRVFLIGYELTKET